jgi:hypothetical protein
MDELLDRLDSITNAADLIGAGADFLVSELTTGDAIATLDFLVSVTTCDPIAILDFLVSVTTGDDANAVADDVPAQLSRFGSGFGVIEAARFISGVAGDATFWGSCNFGGSTFGGSGFPSLTLLS